VQLVSSFCIWVLGILGHPSSKDIPHLFLQAVQDLFEEVLKLSQALHFEQVEVPNMDLLICMLLEVFCELLAFIIHIAKHVPMYL